MVWPHTFLLYKYYQVILKGQQKPSVGAAAGVLPRCPLGHECSLPVAGSDGCALTWEATQPLMKLMNNKGLQRDGPLASREDLLLLCGAVHAPESSVG